MQYVDSDQLQPGQKVQFRLGDVHLPAVQEILSRMTLDTELRGSITLLSDHGDKKTAFVVVEVKGILMPIIVPAEAVKVLSEGEVLAEKKSW